MARVPDFDPDGDLAFMYEQVAAHLEARIRAGELPPGSRLPGERGLASEYGVAIGTARKAIGLLRARGLVATRAALGSFVAREIPPPQS
jgi:GntR family transcriptional regulator